MREGNFIPEKFISHSDEPDETKQRKSKKQSRRDFLKTTFVAGSALYGSTRETYPQQSRDTEVWVSGKIESPPSQELLKKIKDMCKDFSNFEPPIVVRLVKKETGMSTATMDIIDGKVEVIINIERFTAPEFDQEGEIVLSHELAHGIIDQDPEEPNNLPREKVNQAFRELVQEIQSLGPPPYDSKEFIEELENNPKYLFNIFDESSYIRPKREANIQHIGHPYNGSREFFASALNTFRYFAGEFSKRYIELNDKQKKLIRNAGVSVLNLAGHYNKSGDKSLQELLPEINLLRKTFQ